MSTHEEMEEAAGNTVKLPPMKGVYSCQPYTASAWFKGMWTVGGVFLLINCLLLLWAHQTNRKPPILQERITAEQYSKEHMTSRIRRASGRRYSAVEGERTSEQFLACA